MKISLRQNKILNPNLIITARESRGITQKELAEKLSMNQGWLSRAETGVREVSPEVLKKISVILNYPVDFFYLETKIYGLGPTELFNRKRQSVPMKIIQKIHSQINIRRIQISKMMKSIEFQNNNIPNYDIDDFRGSIKDIANTVRAYWRLPSGPIKNLIEVIEDNGGMIISFDFGTPKIDAMSVVFPDTPPLFFINSTCPKSRLRFTLCHELGHIVMHQNSLNPNIEIQADQFASEFLLPSSEIKPYLLNGVTISKLADLKRYWKVSMQAILMKAKDLDCITPSQLTSIWIQMGKNGYRTNEPLENEIPSEFPTLLDEVVDFYKDELNYSLNEFSQLVYLSEAETKSTYYNNGKVLRLVK